MLNDKTVLGLVVGRGGSKGLRRKNVLPFLGKPMIAWTVEAARASRYIDRVVVSSDDEEIIAAAAQAGAEVPFRRPPELATDTVTIVPVALHALDAIGGRWDYLVLLQATSPLRNADDIDGCIARIDATAAPTCLSVNETLAPPYQTFTMEPDGVLRTVIGDRLPDKRRQELPVTYQLNGAVCVVCVDWFRQFQAVWEVGSVGHAIPVERGIDIDSATDFALAEFFGQRTPQQARL